MEIQKDKKFEKFLQELKQQNSLLLVNDLLQTKFQRELAGEDDDKREKQLDAVVEKLEEIKQVLVSKNSSITTKGSGSFSREVLNVDDEVASRDEVNQLAIANIKDYFKSFGRDIVDNFKILKGVFSKEQKPGEGKMDAPQPVMSAKEKFIKATVTNEQIKNWGPDAANRAAANVYEKNVKNWGTDAAVKNAEKIYNSKYDESNFTQNTINKNKVDSSTKSIVSQNINPEADNIVSADEELAENSTKQLEISQKLLDTTIESLGEIRKLRETFESGLVSRRESKEQDNTVSPEPGKEEGSSVSPLSVAADVVDMLPDSKGRAPKAGGMGNALKSIGSKALSAAKFLGPAAALAGAAYGGVTGYQNTAENFDLKEGEEATTGQKISSTLGGVASSLSFGLVDEKSAAQGIQGAGEKIGKYGSKAIGAVGGFFGGIGNKISDTVGYAKKQAGLDLSGGVGKELSEALVGTKETLKTSEVTDSAGQTVASKDYRSGITSERSIFGSKLLGSLFSSKGQEIGSFLGSSEESKNFSAVGDEATSFNKSGSIMGQRISSGSIFKSDKYSVTDDSDQKMDVSKSQYFKIQELAKEGKTEEAKKMMADIKMRREVNEEVAASIKSPEESLTPITPKMPSSTAANDVKTGSMENVALRDETAATKNQSQPIISSSVNNMTKNNYMPTKAEPHPTNRGSALDRYLAKSSVY